MCIDPEILPPKMYDITTDEMRFVTQEDVDRWILYVAQLRARVRELEK